MSNKSQNVFAFEAPQVQTFMRTPEDRAARKREVDQKAIDEARAVIADCIEAARMNRPQIAAKYRPKSAQEGDQG